MSTKSKTKKSTAIPVHIYLVLDRTGSMNEIKSDVIGGFNAWLEDQQNEPGKCRFTMIQFNSGDPHNLTYDAVPIGDVEPLTVETFRCSGGTPLLDAEGWMIDYATARESQRVRDGKPAEAILFVTYTDGDENSSREFTFASLTALKKEREAAGWTFTYLGVGHDAYNQARSVGTNIAATRSHDRSSKGVAGSFADVSQASTQVRTMAARGARVASADLYTVPSEPAGSPT